MKISNKSSFDEDDALQAQMMERIEELIERVIIETVFDFLNQFLDDKKKRRPPVCYRSDCRGRDEIPF